MTDRLDPEVGMVRRCRVCDEEWPLDLSCFDRMWGERGKGRFMRTCKACQAERRAKVRTPKPDTVYRRVRRAGPEAEALRARQREASRRHYWRNVERVRERRRELYAEALDRPVRDGFGRPRSTVLAPTNDEIALGSKQNQPRTFAA